MISSGAWVELVDDVAVLFREASRARLNSLLRRSKGMLAFLENSVPDRESLGEHNRSEGSAEHMN